MINGIINVYKEKGFTSHDVVAKLRGILKQKKIGHTGTLDPDAEGVLPVCLGNGTKLCDMLTDKDKTYEAVLLLGVATDTQDITGKVLETSEVTATKKEIEAAIVSFIGDYEQLPPMYSAIKVGGKRLYELARAGKEVERETRKVRIHNIRILEFDEENHEVLIAVHCSKGTYIRTLCHDIGIKLDCGGCMKKLLRTRAGQFTIDNSITLQGIQDLQEKGQLLEQVIKVDQMFSHYTKVIVAEMYSKYLYNGNSFEIKHLAKTDETLPDKSDESSVLVRVYDWQNQFTGIYEYIGEGTFKPVKMFL